MPHKTASFHFFGSLSELLPSGKPRGAFALAFQAEQSVKHLFESCGVPHTEVREITANGATYVIQRRQVGLALRAYGDQVFPALLPTGGLSAEGERVEYRWSQQVMEWYRNSPQGLGARAGAGPLPCKRRATPGIWPAGRPAAGAGAGRPDAYLAR